MNSVDPNRTIKHMINLKKDIIFSLFLFLSSLISTSTNEEIVIEEAMLTLDRYMESFNAQDMKSWAETLNYPHVRFAGGSVAVWDNKEDYANEDIFEMLKSTGWHHSAWLSREVNLVSERKVHISTVFQRYDKNNQPIKKYQSLYVVTKENGNWGVKARSSLAP